MVFDESLWVGFDRKMSSRPTTVVIGHKGSVVTVTSLSLNSFLSDENMTDYLMTTMKNDKDKAFKFTLSIPPSHSELSSPSSSPLSPPPTNGFHSQNEQHNNNDRDLNVKDRHEQHILILPGNQPKDIYDTSLSWWRAAIRRRLVANVQRESRIIARMQVEYRAYRLRRSILSGIASLNCNLNPLFDLV